MRRRTTLVLAAAAFGLVAPRGADAQVPGINLDVIPKIGAYVPLNDLGDVTIEGLTHSVSASSAFAIGLGLELDLPLSPINFRGNLEFVPSTDVTAAGRPATDDLKADILAIVGDVVYRPLPRIVLVQPYFMAGAGIKRYNFRDNDGALRNRLPGSSSDFTAHLAAGVDVGLGPVRILGEVADYISRFNLEGDRNVQNDLFFMVGFRVGLF